MDESKSLAARIARKIGDSSRDRGRAYLAQVVDVAPRAASGYVRAMYGTKLVKVICQTVDEIANGDWIYIQAVGPERYSWYLYAGYGRGQGGALIPAVATGAMPSHVHDHATLSNVQPDQHHARDHELSGSTHTGYLNDVRVGLVAGNVGSHPTLREHVQDAMIHGTPMGAVGEVPTGAIDDNNTSYETAHRFAAGGLRVFFEGAGVTGYHRLDTSEYSEDPDCQGFTMAWPPPADSHILVDYVFEWGLAAAPQHADSHMSGTDPVAWDELRYRFKGDVVTANVSSWVLTQLGTHINLPDAHHPQVHALDGADHSGALSDSKVALTNALGGDITLDQHVQNAIVHGGSFSTAAITDLWVHESNPPAMSVTVEPGGITIVGSGTLQYIGGSLSLPPQIAQPRVDLIYLTYAGVLGRVQGTASDNPMPPTYPTDSMVLAEVLVGAGATAITNDAINDVRPFLSAQPALDDVTLGPENDAYPLGTPPATVTDALNQIRTVIRQLKDPLNSWTSFTNIGTRYMTAIIGRLWNLWAAYINLPAGNVGDHTTLDGHVMDYEIHGGSASGAGGPAYGQVDVVASNGAIKDSIVAADPMQIIRLREGTNVTLTPNVGLRQVEISANAGQGQASNSFRYIRVEDIAGIEKDTVEADSDVDTLIVREGAGISITPSAESDYLIIAVAGSAGGGAGYAIAQEEGAPVLPRGVINFIGEGVTVEDDPLNQRTNVTITGSAVEPLADPTTDDQDLILKVKAANPTGNLALMDTPAGYTSGHAWVASHIESNPDDTTWACTPGVVLGANGTDYLSVIDGNEDTYVRTNDYYAVHILLPLVDPEGASPWTTPTIAAFRIRQGQVGGRYSAKTSMSLRWAEDIYSDVGYSSTEWVMARSWADNTNQGVGIPQDTGLIELERPIQARYWQLSLYSPNTSPDWGFIDVFALELYGLNGERLVPLHSAYYGGTSAGGGQWRTVGGLQYPDDPFILMDDGNVHWGPLNPKSWSLIVDETYYLGDFPIRALTKWPYLITGYEAPYNVPTATYAHASSWPPDPEQAVPIVSGTMTQIVDWKTIGEGYQTRFYPEPDTGPVLGPIPDRSYVYLKWDFGNGSAHAIGGLYVVQGRQDEDAIIALDGTIDLEYSDDGTNWNTYYGDIVFNAEGYALLDIDFTYGDLSDYKHRYYRLRYWHYDGSGLGADLYWNPSCVLLYDEWEMALTTIDDPPLPGQFLGTDEWGSPKWRDIVASGDTTAQLWIQGQWGDPRFQATTLEFQSGTVDNMGSGVIRYTPPQYNFNLYQLVSQKGAANGYAPLDSSAQVPLANLPALPSAASSVVAETSFGQSQVVGVSTSFARQDHSHGTPANPVTAHVAASDPHPGYVLEAAVGSAGGVAPLDGDGKVPEDYLPPGQAPSDHGNLTGLADDDHTQYLNEARHGVVDHTGLPGVGGAPGSTVQEQVTWGLAAAVGTASAYARADHEHGTPADPIPAHLAALDPHSQYATDTDLANHAAAADPHPGYVLEGAIGSANGVASLDGGGKLTASQVPTLYLRSTLGLFHGGTLAVGALPMSTWVHASSILVERVTLKVTEAPVGADIVVDVRADGNSIFADPADRPRVVAGQTSGYTTTIGTATLAQGVEVTVSIAQVGSGTAGSNLSIAIGHRQAATTS